MTFSALFPPPFMEKENDNQEKRSNTSIFNLHKTFSAFLTVGKKRRSESNCGKKINKDCKNP